LSVLAIASMAHAQEADLALGRALYEAQDGCALCHGDLGQGDGPAAPFLFPAPRDFTTGIFKVHSTPFLPTDDDLLRTIGEGMPGTLMPSFAHLSLPERQALVDYVKTFSERFAAGSDEPVPIPDPPGNVEELLTRGEEVYAEVRCDQCHGPSGRGDGPSSDTLEDSWGAPIVPYDFTIAGRMKAGSTPEDQYRTLMVGIGGTPMPSYAEAIPSEEDRWALVYYVLSLSGGAAPALPSGDPVIGKDLFTGSVPFESGSAPCMGCHSVGGIGALGGGVMGPDLTVTTDKYGGDRIVDILATFPFPTMNPIYNSLTLTPEEQVHVRAFLQAALPARPPDQLGLLSLLALAGAGVLLVAAQLLWRHRLTEVRRSMVGART
jgi:mono/diheme cytochrome c family protein